MATTDEHDETSVPLAFDAMDREIEIADGAMFWKVLRCQPGRPVPILDPATSTPLCVPLATTHAELRDKVGGGRFKLVQLDADQQLIKGAVPAYVDLVAAVEKKAPASPVDDAKSPTGAALTQVLDALTKNQETLRASLDRVSTALTDTTRINTEALSILSKLATGQSFVVDENHEPQVIHVPAQPDTVKQVLEVAGPLVPFAVEFLKKKLEAMEDAAERAKAAAPSNGAKS